MNRTALLLLGFIGSLPGFAATTPNAAGAQDVKPPQLVEEAFIGDLAFTQERGEFQVTSLMRAAGAAVNRTARVPLEIEYGITDDIEVSIETGGFNYERSAGWASPNEFGVALRYGRYGLLPNLHASVTIGVESESEDGERTTGTASGLQLGVDIPRLRMTHLFTNVVAGLWNSGQAGNAVEWSAGLVVPVGDLRGVVERPLRVADPESRGTVSGLVWKVGNGFDLGVATTLRTQPAIKLSGVMLSLILEF